MYLLQENLQITVRYRKRLEASPHKAILMIYFYTTTSLINIIFTLQHYEKQHIEIRAYRNLGE